ncbi:hypothetical protein FB451DRAFT_1277110 [Mycena latifolia]|nr:hypothetical protein FB451DRAFT_1277110 [Mycena latifolia]
MSFSLAYGSFGDIIETAKLVKKIVDVLYSLSSMPSIERQKTIAVLKSLYDDIALLLKFTNTDPSSRDGHRLGDRIMAELRSCRSLIDQLCTKMDQSNSLMAKLWMALTEDRELAYWRSEMAERRAVLHTLLELLNIVVSQQSGTQIQDAISHMKYVGGEVNNLTFKVQDIESDIQTVAGQVTKVGVTTMFASRALGESITNVRARVEDVGVEIRAQLQQIVQNTTLHDVMEPMFFVIDPLGGVIRISASYCEGFKDLHRIIMAYLTNRTRAGRGYIERGDYNIVNAEGCVIHPQDFPAKAKPGVRLDISIIKRKIYASNAKGSSCPQCGIILVNVPANAWIVCANPLCGCRYQLSEPKVGPKDINPHRGAGATDIRNQTVILDNSEPEGPELFRLLEIRVVSWVSHRGSEPIMQQEREERQILLGEWTASKARHSEILPMGDESSESSDDEDLEFDVWEDVDAISHQSNDRSESLDDLC